MLQVETVPASLSVLLQVFRPCFTAPSFRMFVALLAGMVAQPGRRTVCGMLVGAGLAPVWRHGRAHWFFAHARWGVEQVGLALVGLIVSGLLPAGAPVLLVVDDTLMRRSGRRVCGAAWQHDGARKGPKSAQVSWGTCFVVVGIVVDLPFLERPVCLPVLARLWRPGGVSKAVLACQMVSAIVTRLAAEATAGPPGRACGRVVHVVADAHYAGADGAQTRRELVGRGLPVGVSLTSRLRRNAALKAIAAPVPDARGRPRRIGARLGTPTDLARTLQWTSQRVSRYGRRDTVEIAETVCLWYGTYRSRAVRVILVREPGSTAKAGHDLALVTTDLDSPAVEIVARYAARWSIEVAFEDARQHTGVGEARNRTTTAVERTVPFGLITQSIVVVWYADHGHSPQIAEDRRAAAPWYRTKTQPSYQDMIIKLRRTLITARFLRGKPRIPTPEETLTVHLAWAEAAA
jgi:DDE superfamily endonuclease